MNNLPPGERVARLQHDLRQPMAAITLAAHNGAAALRAGDVERALAKFDIIRNQIDRCTDLFASNNGDGEVFSHSSPGGGGGPPKAGEG